MLADHDVEPGETLVVEDEPKHRVFSFGYHGWRLASVAPQLMALGVTVVDTRFKPYSRTPEWNKSKLEVALPGAYQWFGDDLGNRNYKGGPIDIINLASGLRRIEQLLEDGDVVVMCMCPAEAECHRLQVLEPLRGRGYRVEALAPKLTR